MYNYIYISLYIEISNIILYIYIHMYILHVHIGRYMHRTRDITDITIDIPKIFEFVGALFALGLPTSSESGGSVSSSLTSPPLQTGRSGIG